MINLDTRTQGFGIFKTQDFYLDGAVIPVDFSVSEASNVILHSEGKSILVTSIEVSANGGFLGKVFGIEPPGGTIDGISAGQKIVFSEHHIFSMGR